MKNIKDFINHLSNREKDLITTELQKKFRGSKSKLLLNRINNYEDFVESLIAKDLYNGAPNSSSSYSHLKRRLKENIIEIVYNDEISNQEKDSIFSDKAKCHRFIMLASLLIERGFKEEATAYLKRAEKLIIDRQFSIERFMFHLLLLEVNNFPDEYQNISEKIVKDIEDLSDLGNSKTNFHKIRIQGYRAADVFNDADDYLADNNVLSNYYKLLTEYRTYVELFQYANAFEYSSKLISLVRKSEKSFSQSETTIAQMAHFRVLIYNLDFKSASGMCNQIERSGLIRFDMEAEFNILKWKFAYLTKQYQKAHKIHEKLSSLSHKTESEGVIIVYLKLVLLFQNKEFDKILRLINEETSLQSTNSPIPHAVKLLEIYCYLELKKTDMASSKLLAFKQYLKRNITMNRDRYQFIIKVLLKLIKSDYKYGITFDYYTRVSTETFKNDIRIITDIHHFELIDFKGWFRKKSIEVGDMYCETVII